MKFFILRSDGVYVSFEGMSQVAINRMLSEQGLSCTYLTEEDFNKAGI